MFQQNYSFHRCIIGLQFLRYVYNTIKFKKNRLALTVKVINALDVARHRFLLFLLYILPIVN